MQAKDVHSILTKQLTPAWKQEGFRRLPGTHSAWYREEKQEFEICRIYLDVHFGYVKPLGGRMFLRAWLSELLVRQPKTLPLTPDDLLPPTVLALSQQLRCQVARKILAGDWAGPMRAADEYGRALLARMRDDLASPEVAAWRDEMGYVDTEDVMGWANFLCGAVPHLAAGLRSRGDTAAG
jgi:hypothetical protein